MQIEFDKFYTIAELAHLTYGEYAKIKDISAINGILSGKKVGNLGGSELTVIQKIVYDEDEKGNLKIQQVLYKLTAQLYGEISPQGN